MCKTRTISSILSLLFSCVFFIMYVDAKIFNFGKSLNTEQKAHIKKEREIKKFDSKIECRRATNHANIIHSNVFSCEQKQILKQYPRFAMPTAGTIYSREHADAEWLNYLARVGKIKPEQARVPALEQEEASKKHVKKIKSIPKGLQRPLKRKKKKHKQAAQEPQKQTTVKKQKSKTEGKATPKKSSKLQSTDMKLQQPIVKKCKPKKVAKRLPKRTKIQRKKDKECRCLKEKVDVRQQHRRLGKKNRMSSVNKSRKQSRVVNRQKTLKKPKVKKQRFKKQRELALVKKQNKQPKFSRKRCKPCLQLQRNASV